MTDDLELEQVVADLVFEVMGLQMPVPSRPTPATGDGYFWTIDGHLCHDNGEPIEVAIAYFWDFWRRGQVSRLVEERGLPAEVVRLVWDALPYESVMFRHGWDEWARQRDERRDRERAASSAAD